MSDGELTRLEVLRDLDQRRLTTAAAARLLGLERRQVFRLLKAYRSAGPPGLISKRRDRPGVNRRRSGDLPLTRLNTLICRRNFIRGGVLIGADGTPSHIDFQSYFKRSIQFQVGSLCRC
jgi:hypothetical protein